MRRSDAIEIKMQAGSCADTVNVQRLTQKCPVGCDAPIYWMAFEPASLGSYLDLSRFLQRRSLGRNRVVIVTSV